MLHPLLRRLSALVTVPCLVLLLWQDARAAARPNTLDVGFKAKLGLKFKKVNGQLVPVQMKINQTKFAIVNREGRWGVAATHRQLMDAAPAFKEELDKMLGAAIGQRAAELAGSGKSGLDTKMSRAQNQARYAAEADQLNGRLHAGYENMLNQRGFAMPRREWRLIEESAEKVGKNPENDKNQQQNQNEEEEANSSNNFWVWLGLAVLAVIVTVAPVLAIAWLASTAVTLATVMTAAVGVTMAVSAGVAFNAGMRAIAGLPLYEFYKGPGSGPGGHYGPRGPAGP